MFFVDTGKNNLSENENISTNVPSQLTFNRSQEKNNWIK